MISEKSPIRSATKNNTISTALVSMLILMVVSTLSALTPFGIPNTSMHNEAYAAENRFEQVNVATNGTMFKQGDAIQLTVSAKNPGSLPITHTTLKSTYATLEGPCGVGYLDFAFIKGYYLDIATYDDLKALKDNVLNVRYVSPYDGYSCPLGYFENAIAAKISPGDYNATITYTTRDGRTVDWNQRLLQMLVVDKYYDKTDTTEQITSDTFRVYKASHPLDTGTYTIIAFTQSGAVSNPIVIEIVPDTDVTTTLNSSSSGLSSLSSSITSFFGWMGGSYSIGALAMLSAVFGIFLSANFFRRNRSAVFLMTLLALSVVATIEIVRYEVAPAYAVYNKSSQGVEGPTLFTKSTVEGQLKGIKFQALGDSKGMSTQNNQFIKPFAVGNNWFWSQSFVQAYAPLDATANTYTCTLQDGSSYSCNYYSKVTLRGTVNFWTMPNLFGQCPTDFTSQPNGACARILIGNYQTFTYGSSGYRRIDFNTYQEIQTDGWVYLDQKVRQCTSSGSCTSYTTLPTSYPRSFQYALSTSKYDIQYVNGPDKYYYGLEGEVGFCCGYRVYYQTGTYINQVYTVNLSTTNAGYRTAGEANFPTEQNANFCWWDTITKSGSTTFTTSGKYSTSCSS